MILRERKFVLTVLVDIEEILLRMSLTSKDLMM